MHLRPSRSQRTRPPPRPQLSTRRRTCATPTLACISRRMRSHAPVNHVTAPEAKQPRCGPPILATSASPTGQHQPRAPAPMRTARAIPIVRHAARRTGPARSPRRRCTCGTPASGPDRSDRRDAHGQTFIAAHAAMRWASRTTVSADVGGRSASSFPRLVPEVPSYWVRVGLPCVC